MRGISFLNLLREWVYPGQTDLSSTIPLIPWGIRNDFPQKLADLVQNSPTSSSCQSTLTDFYTGEGFNNQDLERRIVNNQGVTFFQFHHVTADSLSLYDGFAWLVKYDRGGRIIELYNLPFENCRLCEPDGKGFIAKIAYNPYFGTDLYRPKDNKFYDVFNPKAALVQSTLEGNKYKGQIFWYGKRRTLSIFYPKPIYWSSEYWMEVEMRSGQYFKNNLSDGFLQPFYFGIVGDPHEPIQLPGESEDEEQKTITRGDLWDQEMSNNFSGSRRSGTIPTFWGANKEEIPQVLPFPANNNAETYNAQDRQAMEKIMIAWKVPSILAINREGQSLGGDGNSIRAAVKLMQQRAVRPQSILTDAYSEVLKNSKMPFMEPISVVPYNPYPEVNTVDPQVWTEMTKDERRKWIKDHTEIELFDEQGAAVTEPPTPTLKVESTPIFQNISYNSYPEKIRKNVERAVKWQNDTGNKCSKSIGLAFSQRIMNGESLSVKEIKKILNFLRKNSQFANMPFDKDCNSVLYHAWGGTEMMEWAELKIKELFE